MNLLQGKQGVLCEICTRRRRHLVGASLIACNPRRGIPLQPMIHHVTRRMPERYLLEKDEHTGNFQSQNLSFTSLLVGGWETPISDTAHCCVQDTVTHNRVIQ